MSTCQWIDGDPLGPDWDYCGKPAMAPGAPWCREHYERVYQFDRHAASKRRINPTSPTSRKAA